MPLSTTGRALLFRADPVRSSPGVGSPVAARPLVAWAATVDAPTDGREGAELVAPVLRSRVALYRRVRRAASGVQSPRGEDGCVAGVVDADAGDGDGWGHLGDGQQRVQPARDGLGG